MASEIMKFKYEQLDGETADFLRQKETNMREIVGKAYTELGRELYEAQQELAGNNQYDGVFEKWYTYIGFKKDKVYDLIRRYKMLVGISEDQTRELIEDLPVSLSYEIAKPSAESTPAKAQAKSEVLAGDIESLKKYKERIKELEMENEQLAKKADKPPEIRTEYIEIDNTPNDYEQLKKEKEELAKRLAEIPETKQTQDNERPYGVKLGVEMYEALSELSDWQKKYSWIITDVGEFSRLAEADPNFRREFNRLNEFWRQMNEAVNRNKGATVFEADYEIIN